MRFWMKNVEEVEQVVEEKAVGRTYSEFEDKTTRVKEVVDLAISLYKIGCEDDYYEIEKHVEAEYDSKHGLVFFNLITEDIQDMVEYIRTQKDNHEPVSVDDYYMVSHIICKLRRMISVNKKRNID